MEEDQTKEVGTERDEDQKDERLDWAENPEQVYIGTKIIKGIPMDHRTFINKIKHLDFMENENQPGYKVTYPDGYVRWSPKKAFDDSHRLVTAGEFNLFAM